MSPPKGGREVTHQEGADWCSCPRCGERISLVKKRKTTALKERTMVVIDDDLGIRNLLETVFEEEGYRVFSAERADEGMDLLCLKNPSIVFLDVRLPDTHGIDLLKRIKRFDRNITVIMITAYGDSKDAVKCMTLGAAAYVTKPFDVQYVSMLVQNQLG